MGQAFAYRPKLETLERRDVPGFLAPVTYPTGPSPHKPAIADFNGDGKSDVAVPAFSNSCVDVFLGNGDGTLQAYKQYRVHESGSGPSLGMCWRPSKALD